MLILENKIEFENNCWIAYIDASGWNNSDTSRINAITDIASIATGRLGFSDDYCIGRKMKLYKKLLVESAGRPSTPFEFIPVFTDMHPDDIIFHNTYHKYATHVKFKGIYTNLRNELINAGIAQYNQEAKGFHVVVGRIPWKAVYHLRTHRAFSWIVESSRNKRYFNNVKFWYPSWWNERYSSNFKHFDAMMMEIHKADVFNKYLRPEEATMELPDRRLVYFAMAAWQQDKNSWENIFSVRGEKTGTMSITSIAVEKIKELILLKNEK